MRHIDELMCTLTDRLAVQVSYAVFSHHIADMVPAGNYTRALFKHGSNASHKCAAFQGRGAWQGNDRYAAFGTRSAINKIELPAHTAIKFGSDTISTDLTGKIDLNCGVNGNHALILCDHKRVVHIFRRTQFDHRVIIHPLIKFLRADDTAGKDFPT